MQRSTKNNPIVRTGHTLIELLLVLAILAMAMAMAIPTYESMVSGRRLQNSAESLEVQLQEARVKAMRTGQSQVFRFDVGASTYTCEPWLSGAEELNSGPGAAMQSLSGQILETSSSPGSLGSQVDVSKGSKKLEEGIVFASANTANDSRTAYAQVQEGGATAVGGNTPVMFYPDGTSTTAEIVVQDSEGRQRTIQLRGLTGRTKMVARNAQTSM